MDALGRPYGPKSGPGLTACFDVLKRSAACTLRLHDRNRSLGAALVPPEIQLEALPQRLFIDVTDAALPRRAGIGDENIESAKRPADLRKSLVDRCGTRNIAFHRNAADYRANGLRRFQIPVENSHLGALSGKCHRRRRANARAAAGDRDHVAGQRFLNSFPSFACSSDQYSISKMSFSGMHL